MDRVAHLSLISVLESIKYKKEKKNLRLGLMRTTLNTHMGIGNVIGKVT